MGPVPRAEARSTMQQSIKKYFRGGDMLREQMAVPEAPDKTLHLECRSSPDLWRAKHQNNIYKKYLGTQQSTKSIFKGAERQWCKGLSRELQAKHCIWNRCHAQSCKESSAMQQSTKKSSLIEAKWCAWSQGRPKDARSQATQQSPTKLVLTDGSWGKRTEPEAKGQGAKQNVTIHQQIIFNSQ